MADLKSQGGVLSRTLNSNCQNKLFFSLTKLFFLKLTKLTAVTCILMS